MVRDDAKKGSVHMMAMSTVSVLSGSFCKLRSGAWGIRVAGLASPGDAVDVTKRDGSTSRVWVDAIVWTDRVKVTLASFSNVAPSTVSACLAAPAVLTDDEIEAEAARIAALGPMTTTTPAKWIIKASAPVALTALPAIVAAPSRKTIGRCAKIDQAYTRDSFIASHCACCGATLTDAESIQCGMGPICRRGHGFDVADDSPAWGECLAALGASFPVDTYEEIVECSKRYRRAVCNDTATDADKAVDAKRAVKVLVHRIAVAEAAHTDGATVIRCVLAIEKLGYTTLARVLARALIRRPTLRDLPGAPQVVSYEVKGADLYVRTTCDDWRFTRAMRIASINFETARGGWKVNAAHADRLLVIGQNMADLTVTTDAIVNTLDMTDPTPVYDMWTDAGERTEWCDVATGEHRRVAIPGEPASRPGWEKVPAVFFSQGDAAYQNLAGDK